MQLCRIIRLRCTLRTPPHLDGSGKNSTLYIFLFPPNFLDGQEGGYLARAEGFAPYPYPRSILLFSHLIPARVISADPKEWWGGELPAAAQRLPFTSQKGPTSCLCFHRTGGGSINASIVLEAEACGPSSSCQKRRYWHSKRTSFLGREEAVRGQ